MDIKQILTQHGFRFNKQFGQNFLTDEALLDGIVRQAGITAEDTVLEVGAGAGTLTRRLALAAKKVVAFEIDKNLQPVLQQTVGSLANVQVEICDFMKLSVQQIEKFAGSKPFKVTANIPYYITTPLIMTFVENCNNVLGLTLTVQKEVADRLAAKPGRKDYGAITVAVQAVADVKIVAVLDRSLFLPVPNVDSAVVQITFCRSKHNIQDAAFFRKTVKSAFAMRRKTLVNNLVNDFKISREQAANLLSGLQIDNAARGETLSVEKFIQLSAVLCQTVAKGN